MTIQSLGSFTEISRELNRHGGMSQTAERRHLVVIVAPIKGVKSFHFTSTALQGQDLWFPVGETSLFVAIERAMVANEVAHNVTSVSEIRENTEDSSDYLVRFNRGRKCE